MKKMLFLLCLLTTFLFSSVPVFAEEELPEEEVPEETTEPIAEEEPQEVMEENVGPEIKAPSAILIDAASGRVLAKKNSSRRMAPAGLAKIMGVYLACENLPDTLNIKMSKDAFTTYDHNTSVIWIMEGETVPAEDLEYAAIVQNANDTMAMLAEAVSGNQEAFVDKMNATAEELGMKNTHFVNIFGLNADGSYSTVEDLAILTRKALKNNTFKNTFAAPSYVIAPTAMQSNERVLAANCEMIREGSYKYESATGCKLGYTMNDGYTLAVSAHRDSLNLIVILLGEEKEADCYSDAKTLFEYGFSHYQNIEITPSQIGTKTVEIYEGDKHVSDVIFSVTQGFSALLPSSVKQDDLKVEIVTMNEETNNPDLIEAQVVFSLQGTQVGTAEMKKSIRHNDTADSKSGMKIGPREIFDGFSIVVFIVIMGLYWSKVLTPPSE